MNKKEVGGKSFSQRRSLETLKKLPFSRGKAYVIRALAKRLPSFRKASFKINEISISLDLSKNSELYYYLHEKIPHEIGFEKILSSLVNQETIFYDIGANIGYYSFKFANIANHIYAFEPNPYLESKLKSVCNVNKVNNISVFGVGLADEDSFLELKISEGNHATGSFITENDKNHNTTLVPIKKLDSIILNETLPFPTLIKLDVEGYELNVLKGYTNLKQHKPIVFFEWLDYLVEHTGSQFNDLYNYFPKHEWILYRVENNGTLRTSDIETSKSTSDLIACPKNHLQRSILDSIIKN